MRVTEQGETINDRYGLQPIALRTFEQGLNTLALVTAGVLGPEHVDPRWLEAMELLVAREHARITGPSCTTTRRSSTFSGW